MGSGSSIEGANCPRLARLSFRLPHGDAMFSVFSALDGGLELAAGANFGTLAAGMRTFSEGLRGLTPTSAARSLAAKLPNPVTETSSRRFRASVMAVPRGRADAWRATRDL